MRPHFRDLLADILFQIAKRMEGDTRHRSSSGLLLKFRPQFFILERQHPAVGVIDDDEFLGAQKLVRNDQGIAGRLRSQYPRRRE